MKTKYYYIHGLHSSKNSPKFLELSKQYENIECLEWNIDDNITLKLDQWEDIILSNGFENVCVIASSTGGNFAYQLRVRMKCKKHLHLVLINPLLNIDFMFNPTIIPNQLLQYLVKVKKLYDSIIFIGGDDSVIDNEYFLGTTKGNFVKNYNQIIVDKECGHDFVKLSNYYNEINTYVNNIHI